MCAAAYIDWDVYGTTTIDRYQTSIGIREMNLNTTASLEIGQPAAPSIPLLGTGTMRMRCQSGVLHLIPKFPGATATERGLVRGRIRSIIRWNDLGGLLRFGIVVMQSALDLTTTPGNGYVCIFDTLGFTNTIRIGKMTGQTLGSWTTLVSSSPAQFSDDVPLSIEFEWDAFSGVNCGLRVRRGVQTDFSDLVVLINYDDISSPHVTSVAEGLFALPVSGNIDMYWDNTTISKRV